MTSYYTIDIIKQDEQHIPEILRLAKKYNGIVFPYDTKDGKGYEFEFNNDDNRIAFSESISKLGMFKPIVEN